jgi:trans-aconitate 2-methyltransferase
MWDPHQYLRFEEERSRPFFDLVGRIGAASPVGVVDLGCGPGQLTATLKDRWPQADVLGIDSSPEMIGRAAGFARPGLSFRLGDATDYRPGPDVDVVVSNAMFQWIPEHELLVASIADQLAEGAWLAFQVPGHAGRSVSQQLLEELRTSPPWAEIVGPVDKLFALEPEEYLDLLARAGWRVDAWDTMYRHVLAGPDAVLEWMKGTAMRPVLARLGDRADEFCAAYGRLLAKAFPQRGYGTVFPFRRIFVVAERIKS